MINNHIITMNLSKINIYYDGCNFEKYHNHPLVVGFTTNSTYVKQSNFTNYNEFYKNNSKFINNRPISLQITSDNNIEEQSRKLNSFGNNVYAKIPVVNSVGDNNLDVIKKLLNDNIKVNITCIYTYKQVDDIFSYLNKVETPFVVSVFAGGISDAGIDPIDLIKYTTNLFTNMNNVQILWAGVRDNVDIKNAIDTKCHIITLPDSIMDRLTRIGLDLTYLSIDKVKSFNNDAIKLSI